jgi:glyoxylase-like metal-dependent hydrolase (beta-lactamase superfamily II)
LRAFALTRFALFHFPLSCFFTFPIFRFPAFPIFRFSPTLAAQPVARIVPASMPRIPLEDNFTDVIAKAQRGWKLSDDDLLKRAEISADDLAAVRAGKPIIPVLRRLARHLRLSPDALEALALRRWYPEQAIFPRGFAAFNTPCGDMTVNSFLVWDTREKVAAAFDTGADATEMLDLIRAEGLRLRYIFLTHTHHDHVGGLPQLAGETGAEVWSSELEPVNHPGARTFKESAHFHVGTLAIKTILTTGHSPGLTTFLVTGLSWPLAVVGDALFASSMGGSAEHFAEQHRNNKVKLLTLPRDTVLACGHGPMTTLAQEKTHNPFLARQLHR